MLTPTMAGLLNVLEFDFSGCAMSGTLRELTGNPASAQIPNK